MDMKQNFLKESARQADEAIKKAKTKLLAQNRAEATRRLLKILESVDANQVVTTEIGVRHELI